MPAHQDAALGFLAGGNWAPNLDNPQSKTFVAAYKKEYGAVPATYAFQAYDAIKLIDSALKQTKGDTSNKDALRAALMTVRGLQIQHQPLPYPGLLRREGREAPGRQVPDGDR